MQNSHRYHRQNGIPNGEPTHETMAVIAFKNKEQITSRLNIVEYFVKHNELISEYQEAMRLVGDLERLISKVSLARINPREMLQISRALEQIVIIKNLCKASDNDSLKAMGEQLNPCDSLRERIKRSLKTMPRH